MKPFIHEEVTGSFSVRTSNTRWLMKNLNKVQAERALTLLLDSRINWEAIPRGNSNFKDTIENNRRIIANITLMLAKEFNKTILELLAPNRGDDEQILADITYYASLKPEFDNAKA